MEQMMEKQTVGMTVNGKPYRVEIAPDRRLVDVLRDDLHLLGTKEGCGIGECGACTILMNGKTVNSCLVLAGSAQDARILTIEGVAGPDGALHPIQQAYIEAGAVQCGFCTPGMIMSTLALLLECPEPTDAQIKLALSGNLCRCTGYIQIFNAVRLAASRMRDLGMLKGAATC